MPYQANVFEILLAGPGDVEAERREIADAIETWTQRHAHQVKIVMRPVRWETDTYPELGDDPQAIINKQIAGRCDALIAVFSTRLGTTTPRAASGTAEEINRFAAQGMPVAIYFSDGQADLSRLDPAQFQALQEYRESLKDRGMYRGFSSLPDLRKMIDQQLAALGYRFQASVTADTTAAKRTVAGFQPTEVDMKVIAAIGRIVVETRNHATSSLYLSQTPELAGVSQDSIFESLRVLRDQGLTVPLALREGHGRWEVGLASAGLEVWFRNFVPDYERHVRQIATAIVLDDVRWMADIIQRTGLPTIEVQHVLDQWATQGMIILNQVYSDVRVDRFSAEIERLARATGS